MQVDDHNEMHGGVSDALSIRISPQELKVLVAGRIIVGKNKRRGVIVTIQLEQDPKPTSSS